MGMFVPLWGIEIPWLVSEPCCCRVSGCCGSYILWNANSRCSLNHAWASPAGKTGRRCHADGLGWTGRNTDLCIAPALTKTTFRACRPSTRRGHTTKKHLQQSASIMTQLRRQQSHIADSVRTYSTWAASHNRFKQVTAGGTYASGSSIWARWQGCPASVSHVTCHKVALLETTIIAAHSVWLLLCLSRLPAAWRGLGGVTGPHLVRRLPPVSHTSCLPWTPLQQQLCWQEVDVSAAHPEGPVLTRVGWCKSGHRCSRCGQNGWQAHALCPCSPRPGTHAAGVQRLWLLCHGVQCSGCGCVGKGCVSFDISQGDVRVVCPLSNDQCRCWLVL